MTALEGERARVARTGSAPRSGSVRLLFVALLAVWVILPFLQIGALAEDAVPFIAAARVTARDRTEPLYNVDGGILPSPAIREAGCPLVPEGTDCEHFVLPFLSPPLILPVMKVVDLAGGTGAVLLMRLAAALALAFGMWVLWQRLTPRRPEAQVPLLLTAVLLTPFVYVVTVFGQNAPLMFLSACLGLSRTDRTSRAAGAAATWVATVACKLFPLPLVLLAVLRRRWRFVAFGLGGLVLLAAASTAVAPLHAYADFLSSSRALTADSVGSPWNVSLDAFVHALDPGWTGTGSAFYAGLLIRVVLIGALFSWKLRDADEDLQWAYAWVALLALHPQVWWHYFALLVPAVALTLRGRRGRAWYLLPAVALALVPMALVTDQAFLQRYGPLLIVVAVVVIPFLPRAAASRPDRAAAAAAAPA